MTPLGLVTCDTEARIAVVDLAAGRVLRSITVTAGPRAIERVGAGGALICHTTTGLVTLLDGRAAAIRKTFRFAEPRYVARHPDGVHAYVTDSGAQTVTVINVARGNVLGHASLGGPARHITLAPDGRTLWVALGNLAPRIAVIDVTDPSKPRLLRTIAPPFLGHDVGFFPNGKHVWVTAGKAGTTAIYDAGGRPMRVLHADPGPQHVTFGKGVAYVTSGDAGTFRVQTLNGTMLRETPVPVGSYNVQAGPGGLVLTPSLDRGTLCVLDAAGRLRHEIAVSTSSHDACFVF